MQQWDLTVQRQLGSNWLISASYIGNNTIHGWTYDPINPGVDIAGATTANIATRRLLYLENPAQGSSYGVVTYLGMMAALQPMTPACFPSSAALQTALPFRETIPGRTALPTRL